MPPLLAAALPIIIKAVVPLIIDELVKAGMINEAEKVAIKFEYDITQLRTYQDYVIVKNQPFADKGTEAE